MHFEQPKNKSDRFIVNRQAFECAQTMAKLEDKENGSYPEGSYCSLLQQRLQLQETRILKPSFKAPVSYGNNISDLQVLYSANKVGGFTTPKNKIAAPTKHIPSTPERMLDAPGVVDDFYLNVLDWSSQNIVGIALNTNVFIWNGETGQVNQVVKQDNQGNYISSVAWNNDGQFLSIGTNMGLVHIFDINKMKQVRVMNGHPHRVTSICWNNHILSSGGREGKIVNHDVRVRDHVQSILQQHTAEVCGLKWDPSGRYLASGGNDNTVNVWDNMNFEAPLYNITSHNAAVKAISWCPWQPNILATGGGSGCRKMMFWNTSTGGLLNSIDTKSQVCSVLWSLSDRELLTAHGFAHNQLTIWKYPSLVKMKELTGHTSRVLNAVLSPDGTTVATCSSDETLRFWKVFSPCPHKINMPSPNKLSGTAMIR